MNLSDFAQKINEVSLSHPPFPHKTLDSADQIESDVEVNVTSKNKVHVSWTAPDKPNGIVIIHEVMIDKVVLDSGNAIIEDERDIYTVIEPETTPAATVGSFRTFHSTEFYKSQ